MSGSVSIKSGSEEDLLTAVANVGPVSVAIDGANNAFRVSLSVKRVINSSIEARCCYINCLAHDFLSEVQCVYALK